jgi:hypothetical protein
MRNDTKSYSASPCVRENAGAGINRISFLHGRQGSCPQGMAEPMIAFGVEAYPASTPTTLSFINDWQPYVV